LNFSVTYKYVKRGADLFAIQGKAKVEAVNVVGHTALQVAVLQNRMPLVEVLLTKGQ